MTLAYLQTARLNATPLARHVTQKQAQPVYTSLDAMIEDMKADARQIRERHTGMIERETSEEVSEEKILALVKNNPGIDMASLAKAFNRTSSGLRSRMSRMETRGQVKAELFKHPKSFRLTRRFYPVDSPKPTKRGRPMKPAPRRDTVIAFVKANPGCTSAMLAAHLDCSTRAASAHLSEVRKVAKVRTERQKGGSHLPAMYWIEGDA